jgi:hypothetical protein
LNPDSPAFTAIEPRETFLEEALFLHDPLRIAELMAEWQRSMPKLLELAITHELGHAFCEEPNEVAANHFSEELRKGRTVRYECELLVQRMLTTSQHRFPEYCCFGKAEQSRREPTRSNS